MINPDASKAAIVAKNFIYFVDARKEKRWNRFGFEVKDFQKADDFDRYKWKTVTNGVETPWETRIQDGDYNNIIEAILVPELTPWYIYKWTSLASRTKQYRNAMSRPVVASDFIFLSYRANPSTFWIVDMNTFKPHNLAYSKIHLQWGSAAGELKFDKERIKERLEKEDPTAKIESLFKAIEEFAFIDDVDFINWLIMLKFKPPRIDMWTYKGKPVLLRRDALTMMIDLNATSYDRMYKFTRKDHQHPHIDTSGWVCFGTFANYVQQNKDDIESVIVNMYEHMCTYNPNSPFPWSRPRAFFNEENGNLTGLATSRKEVDREFLKIRRGSEEMELADYIARIKKDDPRYQNQELFR